MNLRSTVLRVLSSCLIGGALALGQTFSAGERELKGGETHSYQINLAAGQFFSALIDQKDIDVVVTVFGPDGKKVSETDSPNLWDPEPVLILAENAGDYRVEVSSSAG